MPFYCTTSTVPSGSLPHHSKSVNAILNSGVCSQWSLLQDTDIIHSAVHAATGSHTKKPVVKLATDLKVTDNRGYSCISLLIPALNTGLLRVLKLPMDYEFQHAHKYTYYFSSQMTGISSHLAVIQVLVNDLQDVTV